MVFSQFLLQSKKRFSHFFIPFPTFFDHLHIFVLSAQFPSVVDVLTRSVEADLEFVPATVQRIPTAPKTTAYVVQQLAVVVVALYDVQN